MEEKIELLKELIEISQLGTQLKLNLIVQTLQRTEDIMKAKPTSTKILNGDFSTLKDEAIDNLIGAFAGTKEEQTKVSKSIILNEESDDTDNQTKNLEYELRVLKSQLETAEYQNKQIENEKNRLAEENNKLQTSNAKFIEILTATKMLTLIEVSDKSINELYRQNLQDVTVSKFDEAFIMNDIIPKTYYKLK